MTIQDLIEKVNVAHGNWYGHYKVTIKYRNRTYQCTSTNSLAWDRIHSMDASPIEVVGYYTLRQAYLAFYNECREKNNLSC